MKVKPVDVKDYKYLESLDQFIELFDNRPRESSAEGLKYYLYVIAETFLTLAKLIREENQALREEIEKLKRAQNDL